MPCPRCSGFLTIDLYQDLGCVNCGWRELLEPGDSPLVAVILASGYKIIRRQLLTKSNQSEGEGWRGRANIHIYRKGTLCGQWNLVVENWEEVVMEPTCERCRAAWYEMEASDDRH